MLDFLKGLFDKSGSNIIDSVTNAVDTFVTTKEEKEKLKIELLKIQQDYSIKSEELVQSAEKMYLEDTANAREHDVKIQESSNASFLSKNVAYWIDLGVIVGFFIMLAMILFKTVPEANKELFYTGFGILGTLATTILNFHRGTSHGSKEKQEMIKHLTK